MAKQETARQPLEVVQAVAGAFHHFDLARELHQRSSLKAIYSTFPWQRLVREQLPRDLVHTFPWIHSPLMIAERHWRIPAGLSRAVSWQVAVTFDAWVTRHLPASDVYVALSGAGVSSGRRAQSFGAKYVCDRGSSHIRYQNAIVGEEFRRWGFNQTIVDPRFIAREEAEYAQADAITVPSEFARRSFIEMGVPAEKLHKIPYGVRLDRFRPVGEPPKDRFEVLFVGQVGLRKGVPYLLQAFAQLKHPHKRLRIVGGLSRDLRRILTQLPQDNVEFVGHLPQDRLSTVMSTSHVMVLPSIEEGLALVQAQAMASGCPLISSTNTGGEDLFTDNVEGFIVPIRAPEAITARLQQLADDAALQQRMREAALARVRRIGGWHQYGEEWMALLDRIVTGSTPTAAGTVSK
jgi:glycosyltransferase involved in cell wall biosynthesis